MKEDQTTSTVNKAVDYFAPKMSEEENKVMMRKRLLKNKKSFDFLDVYYFIGIFIVSILCLIIGIAIPPFLVVIVPALVGIIAYIPIKRYKVARLLELKIEDIAFSEVLGSEIVHGKLIQKLNDIETEKGLVQKITNNNKAELRKLESDLQGKILNSEERLEEHKVRIRESTQILEQRRAGIEEAAKKLELRRVAVEEQLERRKAMLEESTGEAYKQIKALIRVMRKTRNEMSGVQYEMYCAVVLASQGFREIQMTKKSGDYGIDIIALDPFGNKYGIQCKCYDSSVGVSAVQEVYAGIRYYNCELAMVVTNNVFTKQAHDLADKLGIELREDF